MTALKTRAFDTARHIVRGGAVFEIIDEVIDESGLRASYRRIGRLGTKKIQAREAWEANVYEQVIVEDA